MFSRDNSIIVFDLDDTLVVTNAKIIVKDQISNEVFELTPQQFNEYIKEPHHDVSYHQFNDPNILRAGRLVDWVLSILKRAYESGTAIGIITARDNKDLVRSFLLENGIDIHPNLIFAISDPNETFSGTIAKRKKQAFIRLINKGFSNFTFYDDDRKNLELAKELESEYDMTIKTRKIGRTQVPKLSIKRIGIFSGKFKPPHKGHYEAIKKMAQENDEVYVFVSKKEVDGISGSAAVKVLNYYFEEDSNVFFELAQVTPVRSGYELIEKLGLAKDAPNTIINLYATAEDMPRWAAAEKWKGALSKIVKVTTSRPEFTQPSGEGPVDDDGVSGTLMRRLWREGKEEEFAQGIPDSKDPAKVWMILSDQIEEDLLLPDMPRDRKIVNTDINVDPPHIEPSTVTGGSLNGIPAHWGSYRASRQELSAPGVSPSRNRIKNFSEYIFDK